VVLSFHGGGANGVRTIDLDFIERRYSLTADRLTYVCHSCDQSAWYSGSKFNLANQENNQVATGLKRIDYSLPRFVEEIGKTKSR
ncbi:hypothetical protein, partial [Lactobacillus pasteurii]|uniref:hypothetical protein n=1 Tax=Lactobacillus pasteurii TaxID=872327 RepID=UPI001EE39FFD